MSKKLPVVVEKKLGRQKAAGQAKDWENKIEIDPRQSSYEYMDTEVHELIHIIEPKWSERKVAAFSKKVSKFLWKQNYRKVKL